MCVYVFVCQSLRHLDYSYYYIIHNSHTFIIIQTSAFQCPALDGFKRLPAAIAATYLLLLLSPPNKCEININAIANGIFGQCLAIAGGQNIGAYSYVHTNIHILYMPVSSQLCLPFAALVIVC